MHDVFSVTMTPDSMWLISGSWDGGVHFWNPENGDAEVRLKAHVVYNSESINSFTQPEKLEAN